MDSMGSCPTIVAVSAIARSVQCCVHICDVNLYSFIIIATYLDKQLKEKVSYKHHTDSGLFCFGCSTGASG